MFVFKHPVGAIPWRMELLNLLFALGGSWTLSDCACSTKALRMSSLRQTAGKGDSHCHNFNGTLAERSTSAQAITPTRTSDSKCSEVCRECAQMTSPTWYARSH